LSKLPPSKPTPLRTTDPDRGSGPRTQPSDEFQPGGRIGDYVVERLIAHGGCGHVYAAEHTVLGRRAALKVLRRDLSSAQDAVARFVREARAVNAIRHPNIVDIYEFGRLPDGRPYHVMELLDGDELESILRHDGPFSPARALEVLRPVCSAVEAAHAMGVIHRDLKASNIMLGTRDGQPRVTLLDFGIAKLIDRSAIGVTTSTPIGQHIGTPYAMAPEQIRGTAVDARTDVYAMGVLLFQLLTGRVPFQADDNQEIERMHLDEEPPKPSRYVDATPQIDMVVLCCMAKQPDARYPSIRAFQAALEAAVASR
jgi:serine/threonine-protein kinase